ncbi:MAG TPA: ATP-binding protein [Bryobacteraceae bacterium]|jgi:signal transduction histidine kinase|nr:ATP-binding protein [Bryobacteraceae bacterium]
MLKVRNYSIRQKLTWMNMLVSGAALLLACTAFAGYELTDFRQTLVQGLSIQAQIVGANSASSLLFNDPEAARNTLSALTAAPNIISASIFTPDGVLFATYSRDNSPARPPMPVMNAGQIETYQFTADELILVRAIEFQGKRIGTVGIRSSLREVNDRLLRYAGIVVAVLLVSLLAAFAFSSVLQKATARPIAQLAETARIVSREKKYSIRAPAARNADEIGGLIDAFNQMLEQIQERDSALEAARDELELRVAQRTSQLEAVNRELESFTYSVAHDLRAPLRHIQGFADALTEEGSERLDTAAKGYLNSIIDSTRRMDQLINDLLGLAQVGRRELRILPVQLKPLVEDVVRDLALETQGRSIEWRVGDLPTVDCDPGLAKQVFYNLLSNAAKYSRPRDPAVIEAGQTILNGERILFVRDNGVGFNMKYAHKLFGVFERLHRREDFEGTGVGLATVQRIIHKHGGRIWAEAAIDQGATFFFTLTAPISTSARPEAVETI